MKEFITALTTGGSTQPQLLSKEYPLRLGVISDTEIFVYWSSSGQSYKLYRALLSDYSDEQLIYEGTALTFQDTSLTPDTIYFYRLQGANDTYSYAFERTYNINPIFWFEFTGLYFNTNNRYGSVQNVGGVEEADPIRSFFNGISATKTGGQIKFTDYHPNWAYGLIQLANSYYTLSAKQSETDFMFLMKFVYKGPGILLQDSAKTKGYLRIASSTQVEIGNEEANSVTIPVATLVDGNTYDMVFRKEGSIVSISLDGGASYASDTLNANPFEFDILFSSAAPGTYGRGYIIRMVLAPILPQTQIDNIFDYLSVKPFVEQQQVPIQVSGIDYIDIPTDNYITTENVALTNGVTPYRPGHAVLVADDWVFIALNSNSFEQGGLNENLFMVYNMDTKKVSPDNSFGVYGPVRDVHLQPNIIIDNGRLLYTRVYPWYESRNSFLIREYGKFYDMSVFNERPNAKGIPLSVGRRSGYPQVNKIGNEWFLGVQVLTSAGAKNVLEVLKTVDRNKQVRNRFLTNDENITLVPYANFGYTDSKLCCFINLFDESIGQYGQVCYLESDDGITFYNQDRSWNKDCSNAEYINYTELNANASVLSLLGQPVTQWTRIVSFREYSDEFVAYGGYNTDYVVLKRSGVNTFTQHTVDFGSIIPVPTLSGGTSLEMGGFCHKVTTDTYRVFQIVYHPTTTRKVIAEFISIDNCLTWSFVQYWGDINSDHNAIRINDNAGKTARHCIIAARDNVNKSDVYITEI